MFKNLFTKKFIVFCIFVFFASAVVLYGDPNGRTGRTLKNSTSGCGGCHGGTATTDVIVTITGPDSVTKGTTAQYTLTVSKQSKLGAGLDIATRLGILAPVSNTIHLSGGELTHNANITMTNGTATVTFSYTAPNASGTDTIWATGLATNSNGGSSGDDWNWAPSKRVVIREPLGIEPTSTIAEEFKLTQNYPNPFNPTTKFEVSLPKQEFASLKIYDISGKEVYTFANEIMKIGTYVFEWNSVNNSGKLVNSGVYFIRLVTNDYTETRKIMLIK